MASVVELLDRVREGGEPAVDAARTLGLLLERETLRREPGDDGGLGVLLDDDWLNRRLDDQECQEVVDGLLDYVRDTPEPITTVVWALAKSAESRIVPPLIDLLRRVVGDERLEDLAYQALSAIIIASPGSGHEAEARAAVWEAARCGHGQVADSANDYLLAQP